MGSMFGLPRFIPLDGAKSYEIPADLVGYAFRCDQDDDCTGCSAIYRIRGCILYDDILAYTDTVSFPIFFGTAV